MGSESHIIPFKLRQLKLREAYALLVSVSLFYYLLHRGKFFARRKISRKQCDVRLRRERKKASGITCAFTSFPAVSQKRHLRLNTLGRKRGNKIEHTFSRFAKNHAISTLATNRMDTAPTQRLPWTSHPNYFSGHVVGNNLTNLGFIFEVYSTSLATRFLNRAS